MISQTWKALLQVAFSTTVIWLEYVCLPILEIRKWHTAFLSLDWLADCILSVDKTGVFRSTEAHVLWYLGASLYLFYTVTWQLTQLLCILVFESSISSYHKKFAPEQLIIHLQLHRMCIVHIFTLRMSMETHSQRWCFSSPFKINAFTYNFNGISSVFLLDSQDLIRWKSYEQRSVFRCFVNE